MAGHRVVFELDVALDHFVVLVSSATGITITVTVVVDVTVDGTAVRVGVGVAIVVAGHMYNIAPEKNIVGAKRLVALVTVCRKRRPK